MSCAHNFTRNKCMICTSCGVCTGFGANCVRCRGKNRSGDKGRECGCGAGDSGCSKCGKCKDCTANDPHNYVTKQCMICTACGVCTGYGANCCECRGKNRTGDRGKLCGCGQGVSGCATCGKCNSCGDRSPCVPASTIAACSHNYVSKNCKICTFCSFCTGYGQGCCKCVGKNRSGDKGRECGCGVGESGCSKCGVCKKCGDAALALTRAQPPVTTGSIPHPGSFPGCGGNVDGITNCRGSGNCGSGCSSCGARTHWTCCGSTVEHSTHCLPGVTLGQATINKDAMFQAHPSPMRVRDIPGVRFGNSYGALTVSGGRPHNYVTNRCKICTSCGVCTGYGANCVRCRGKDRSGDKGQDCGCGAGESGCSTCGKCKNCGGSGLTCGGTCDHNFVSNKCKICTSCGVCTGYGANCVRCRGKDRSGDKGRECGCGVGESGCSKCGICKNCAPSSSTSLVPSGGSSSTVVSTSSSSSGPPYRSPHPGSFPGCGGNPYGKSNCKGGGNCGTFCDSCGAHTHWSCCGSIDPDSTHCLSHVSPAQAIKNKDAVFKEHSTPILMSRIPGVQYGCSHPGSFPGCGGNPDGITNCRGSGNCGPGCSNCGARTHWSCCGSTDEHSTHCPPHIAPGQAVKNKDAVFAEHSTPTRVRNIPWVNYGSGSAHNYVTDKCKICTQCGVCTGFGANCCECRGKDRSADRGQLCGCGGGASGCSKCGKCEKCGGTGHTCTGGYSAPPPVVPPVNTYTYTSPPKPPIPESPPELEEWFYKDVQQNVQGPYVASSMRAWHEGGYFHENLLLKKSNWKAFHTMKKIFPNMAVAFTVKVNEPIGAPIGLPAPPQPTPQPQTHFPPPDVPLNHFNDMSITVDEGNPTTDSAVNRFIDAGVLETGVYRNPIAGLFPSHLQCVSLQQALEPIIQLHPNISRSMRVADRKARKVAHRYPHLTHDERMAIVLYTMEEVPAETSVRSLLCRSSLFLLLCTLSCVR